MTVTWTSGYNIDEATPLVEWGWKGHTKQLSPAGTLTFTRGSMCGMLSNLSFFINFAQKINMLNMYVFNGRIGPPARTVGWRDPGFIHTSFLKELWPNTMYV